MAGGGDSAAMAQAVPPVQPAPPPTLPELLQEYVGGGAYGWYGKAVRALPPLIDDLTADFGPDLYDRMARDPQVAACLTVFKASVLEDGADLAPAIDDSEDPEYELAMQIRDEAEVMLEDLEVPLDDVLWDLLAALHLGNRVAEVRYADADAPDGKPRWNVASIKVKHPESTAFVVDAYMNVVGLLVRMPGQSSPFLAVGGVLDPANLPDNFHPREKFAILVFRPRDADPRGTSLLRAAYKPWWRKLQVEPEYLKYLGQFAGPSVAAVLPDGAKPSVDPASGRPVSPQVVAMRALQEWRNGSAAAFPHDTQLTVVNPAGNGEAFLRAIAQADQQITKAILTQELATEEGEHQARAAAQVHQDVLDTLIRQAKRSVCRMLRHDVLRVWTRLNFGERNEHLTPKVTLGTTEQHDLAPMISAIAALNSSGYIDPSQYADIDDMLGLPVRDMTAEVPEEDQQQPPPAQPGQDGTQEPGQQPQPGSPQGGAPQRSPAPPAPPSRRPGDRGAPQPPGGQRQQPQQPPPDKVAVRGHARGRPQRKPTVSLSDDAGAVRVVRKQVIYDAAGRISRVNEFHATD